MLGEASFFGQQLHLQEQGLWTLKKPSTLGGMKCLQTTYALKDKTGGWLTAQSSQFPWGWRVAGMGVGIRGSERGFSPNLAYREQLFIIICPGVSDQAPFCRATSPQSKTSILSYIWD